MTIPNSLLALLAIGPTHGYGLKASFEHSTAGAWPLNPGQVYTTLTRLERDGLVELATPEDHDERVWRLTETGRAALGDWYRTPVDHRSTRDELVIKVLLALASGEPEFERVLQTQREATMWRLQRYTRQKITEEEVDLAALLLLDALILRAEAEIRWLDLAEERVAAGAQGT